LNAIYHQLPNAVPLATAEELTLPRARQIAAAVAAHPDFTLIALLAQPLGEGQGQLESVVVEATCEGVPTRNPVGIGYRERLALRVPVDEKYPVEVLTLRVDFPDLIHQNLTAPGSPASLCLYFEPSVAVRRTWTAASFLRRIQWWLVASARGELHPADQPVETLFFAGQHELILPWNFDVLKADPAVQFTVRCGHERKGGALSCFVERIQPDAPPMTKKVCLLPLSFPPIVHGRIERLPQTLGQLADTLATRNLDLGAILMPALEGQVSDAGRSVEEDDDLTIVLIEVPITRAPDEPPSAISHRALLLTGGRLALGEATGALFQHEGRYYRTTGILGGEAEDSWRDRRVSPMAVLRMNDPATARRHSGIVDEGPTGVVIGAGSLGSAILNLWGRAGWGTWTVIDNDHIKPHNLSRHLAYGYQVGQMKVDVVASHHLLMSEGASRVTAVTADATDFDNNQVRTALSEAELVVDVSTTLEYPRKASQEDTFARHMSVFITPSGNAGVLLSEDADRSIRLRTVEAQYYRALIQHEWGKDHLQASLGSFWSGAGCRDLSVVLPYSRIMGQASTLAEHVPLIASKAEAAIRIWCREADTGAIMCHATTPAGERRIPLDKFDLYIDAGAEEQLREMRRAAFPNETGGVLLGYYDFNIQAVVIVAGLPAPPDSISTPHAFERGTEGVKEAVVEAMGRTAQVVGYIGEWHSHPPGHGARPSIHDIIQLAHLAQGMADDGLPAIQLIVGETEICAYQGVAL